MILRPTLLIAAIAFGASTLVALAEKKGQETNIWRVSGVAANDVLNARMGPGTQYPVIETFASNEGGLEQITCVPFYTLRHYNEMTDAELDALPPRWCLMRDAEMQRAGWVAQRFITKESGETTAAEISDQPEMGDPLESLSTLYMEGYEEQETLAVLDQILAGLETTGTQASVFLPSAQINPLSMAVLALEAAEGPRDRVRYRISYGIEWIANPPKYSPLPLSFIQVDRFSLGAAIRQDAIDSYGAENVAPADEFDIGPSVSWRMITAPVMGTRADILAAGRTELSDRQVREMTCLNSACLSSAKEIESLAGWSELKEAPLELDVPFQIDRAGLLTPAATIDLLANQSDFSEPGQPSEIAELPDPFLEAVIEINLAQDTALDAAMRQGALKDDSVAAIWKRVTAIPMGGNGATPIVYRAEAYECHRGPQTPPEYRRCP